MGLIKKSLKGLGLLAFGAMGLSAVNIAQAGPRTPDGRSMEDIIGMDPKEATYEDLEKLSRADKMQLFYAAKAPAFKSMDGLYRAKLLSGGVLGGATAYFTHHVFPTGMLTADTHWQGKAFTPEGEKEGRGINVFSRKGADGKPEVFYARKLRTYVGPTTIGKDGTDSFHLDYKPFNKDVVMTMHDEVRQVNDNLHICAGYMSVTGGGMNPGPFALIGPPSKFSGEEAL
jgi:hypothetical protein